MQGGRQAKQAESNRRRRRRDPGQDGLKREVSEETSDIKLQKTSERQPIEPSNVDDCLRKLVCRYPVKSHQSSAIRRFRQKGPAATVEEMEMLMCLLTIGNVVRFQVKMHI